MGYNKKFDAIVVGAGPAGIACAYLLAKAGLSVALIERGETAGAKNVMGGQVYSIPTSQIIPDFAKEAPLERCITEKRLWILTKDSKISVSYKNPQFGEPPYNAFTVLRAKFDKWFVAKAQEVGALYIPETLVTGLIKDGGRVIGVKTGRADGELYANVVVAADGVNSLISRDAGLHPEIKPENVALAVKEIIDLPSKVIEESFQLEGNQGLTIELIGEVTKGMLGTGFIYTNKNSLSVGVGCILSDWVKYEISPYDLIEEMKNHPAVRPLLRGGQIREYLAHLIPEGGYNAIPPLYADGLLIVGDAGMLVNGLHQEGSNLAMISGRFAAETIIEAKKKGDYSKRSLSLYRQKLDQSFIIKDLKKYRNTYSYLESNKVLFTLYPQILNDAAREFVRVDGTPKKTKQWNIIKSTLAKRNIFDLAKDAFSLWRAFK